MNLIVDVRGYKLDEEASSKLADDSGIPLNYSSTSNLQPPSFTSQPGPVQVLSLTSTMRSHVAIDRHKVVTIVHVRDQKCLSAFLVI